MNDKDIVEKLLLLEGLSKRKLSKLLGYKNQSEITQLLNRKTSLKTEVFVKLLNLLNSQLVITHKSGEKFIIGGDEVVPDNTIISRKFQEAIKTISDSHGLQPEQYLKTAIKFYEDAKK